MLILILIMKFFDDDTDSEILYYLLHLTSTPAYTRSLDGAVILITCLLVALATLAAFADFVSSSLL